MTPLAQRLVRQMIGDPSDEIIPDRANISPMLLEAHCFEITDIFQLAMSLSSDPKFVPDDLTASFLPAPLTWIEYRIGDTRFGNLLIEREDKQKFDMFSVSATKGRSPFDGVGQNYEIIEKTDVIPQSTAAFILCTLAMINTPRIIGRVQHMPHVGLERRLLKNRKNIGKFPLHAWTEIKLRVHPPLEQDGVSHESHLTGKRCLHFCRAHLRIRSGALEYVSAHWRGDASLGVKRSRYVVSP